MNEPKPAEKSYRARYEEAIASLSDAFGLPILMVPVRFSLGIP